VVVSSLLHFFHCRRWHIVRMIAGRDLIRRAWAMHGLVIQ
jgi:hypothetical protein